MGFTKARADGSLFIYEAADGTKVWALFYVDDGLLATQSLETLKSVKKRIPEVCNIRDFADAEVFLGREIKWDIAQRTLKVTQTTFTRALLKKIRMEDCNPCHTPMSVGLQLRTTKDKSGVPAGLSKAFPELIGGLLYLSDNIRYDIVYAVGVLSRAMATPSLADWVAAKGVLRYLKGTEEDGIVFGGASRGSEAYCDVDFAGDMETRRSRTAYIFILDGIAVAWRSRLQPTLAASTTEAEYMAVSQATKKVLWLRTLLQDLDVIRGEGINIGCDNQGALAMVGSERIGERAKHIDAQHHFVKERVRHQEMEFYYTSSTDQKVDFLTKPLSREAFSRCKARVGII
jgi:hypothetical protein